MFSAFQTFGRLGAGARAVAAAWSPSALWPTGTEPGMWIDPSNLTSQWQDSAGTTPVATPGTVADSSNPVGLALDLRLGATVLTDPGNHLLQATSTARPLVSGRVNLLTYTEDFSNGVWGLVDLTITGTSAIAPDGAPTASALTVGVMGTQKFIRENTTRQGGFLTKSCYLKIGVGQRYMSLTLYDTAYKGCVFDLQDGVITLSTGAIGAIDAVGNGWFRCAITVSVTAGMIYDDILFSDAADHLAPAYSGNGTDTIYLWGVQLEHGSSESAYQPILTDGSTYPSAGFPIYPKYDGTDDGMATAAFTAGALINGMDCMIPVRRDSAAACVAGLYNGIADATKFFGMAESASGSGCVGSGAGTPTVWVDGAQLTGGTAVTRGTLHTALSAGDWHILELRGLDLSTWTAAGSGLYTSYVLNGAQGGILLFPSSTPTADRDAARTWLGAKVGLTL